MSTIKKSASIKARAGRIFSFISDPKNMSMLIPHVIRNYNLSKGPIKPGWKFDWEFSLMGIPLKGKWIVTEYVKPKKYAARTEGMANSIWTYTFSEKGGKTLVQVKVDYKLPPIISNKFSEMIVKKINENDLKRFLSNLKTVMEG